MGTKRTARASRQPPEEPLVNVEQRWRKTFDSINDGICLLSLDQKILQCNRAMTTIFGMRREEMVGRHCYEVIHGADKPVPECPVTRMLQTLMRESMELQVKDRWLDVTVDPLLDDAGELTGILHIVRDITERKKNEEALRQSNENLSKIIKTTPDASCITRLVDGTFLEINQAFTDITGYTPEELLGRSSLPGGAALWTNVEDRDRMVTELKTKGEVFSMEMSLRIKDGTIRTSLLSARIFEIDGEKRILTIAHDITERKRMEEALRESEEKYRILAEASPEMIYLVDVQGIVRYVNSAATAMLKGGRGAVIGKRLNDIFPPATADRHLKAIRAVIGSGHPLTAEILEEFPTGPRWIDARLSPVKDSNGAIIGVLGLSADITERINARKSLAESEEKFRMITEQNSEGIILIDEQCLVIEWNAAMERMTGISAAKAKGRPVWEVQGMTALPERWTPQRAEQFKKMFLEAAKTGWSPLFSSPVEAVMVRNGERVYIQQILFPIKTEKGYRLGSVTRDITEKKMAEEALRRSEEKYKALFESAGDAIMLTRIGDAGPQFIDANKKALDLFMITKEEMYKLDPVALSPDKQADGRSSGEAILENIGKAMKGETVVIEWIHRKKDGTDFPCEVTLRKIDLDGPKVIQAIVRDITERKRLEERMARDEKLESLQILAGGIAHDFNNLLAGIFGYIDLARAELPAGNPAIDFLNSSFLAFDRAKHLAQQLLTFAKGGAPQKKPLMLPELVRNTCVLTLSGSNVRGEFRFSEALWPVEADEYQLSQVFSNLIINAVQAMPQGGTVAIAADNTTLKAGQVGTLPAGKYVAVTVKDHGVGIPEKIIGKIFDPFFTTKQKGSGLGLATCYSIVNRHGGFIDAVSEPGVGAVFTVWLPASEKSVELPESLKDTPDLRGSGRVLIMDDERLIRGIARDMLKRAGYEVAVAADGKEAIAKYREAFEAGKKFDAVILDLTVPGGMGGEQAVRELIKIDPQVAAIVSSGYSDDMVLAHFTEYGFTGTVPKPYSLRELLTTVKRVMESKKK
jgi:PAS domain S-box-containing protein